VSNSSVYTKPSLPIKYEDNKKPEKKDSKSRQLFKLLENKNGEKNKKSGDEEISPKSQAKQNFKNFFSSTQKATAPGFHGQLSQDSSPITSINKKRLRSSNSMACSSNNNDSKTNLDTYKFKGSASAFKKPNSNNINTTQKGSLDENWVSINDDISFITLDHSSSSEDDFRTEFLRLRNEKQRKLEDSVSQNEKDVNQQDDDELVFE
jgi:hypothetical protein